MLQESTMKRAFSVLLTLMLFAVGAQSAQAQEKAKSGTVRIEQVNVALFWSASLGGGTLSHKGQSYDFVVGGLGVGGVGASSLKATGEVYDMGRVTDFEGVYGQARVGYALADRSSGKLWLQNAKGVVLALKAERKGLALTLGADGVVVKFK
jgi:hypothetical protein